MPPSIWRALVGGKKTSESQECPPRVVTIAENNCKTLAMSNAAGFDDEPLEAASYTKNEVAAGMRGGEGPDENGTCLEASLSVIVVGASGDLAKKKTYPALLDLFSYGARNRTNATPPPSIMISSERPHRRSSCHGFCFSNVFFALETLLSEPFDTLLLSSRRPR